MSKVLIVVNPNAGEELGLDLVSSLEDIYKKKNIKTKVYKTEGQDDFNKLVKKSMTAGYKNVVVLGGDGTISQFVNGIANLKKRPKILLIPAGTTNNFARVIGADKTRKELLQAINTDALVEVETDVGCINKQYFISSIAVGALPSVGWETDDELKANLGSFAYFLEGIKAMAEEEPEVFDLQMKIGAEEIEKNNLIVFIVSLSNSIMGIQTFFEEATINDGKLHYFGLKRSSLMKEARVLSKQILTKEEIKQDESSFTGSFKQASVHSTSDFNFLIDGEKGLRFPIQLDVLPKHLTFLVPG